MYQRSICTLVTATSLISLGLILLLLRNWIFDLIIAGAYRLGPNSPVFEFWRIPPLQVSIDFYLYNWTNPEDIYNKTIKPNFQEIGPYTFNLNVEKVNITWNPNDTVSFRMSELYYFDEKKSVGKLTDRITTLNIVVVGAVHNLRHKGYFTKKAFSLSLAALSSQIHVTKSADELLFKGYSDPYMDLVQAMPFLSDVASPVDKAGFLYGRNNSYELQGYFNVATGRDRNLGQILRWNYQSEAPYFEGSCKQLKGSIGDFFGENQGRGSINFFLASACRNFVLDYEEDVVVRDINGYKYSALHNMLDNGTFAPENKCLCDGECLPAGMINISACSYGSPSYMSLPHFYNADPVYLSKIEGLRPEKSKHEFYFTLEPTLGVCIDVTLRFQVNFLLQPVEYITQFEDVPKIFIPVLWSEQKASIPVEFAQMVVILMSLPTKIIPTISTFLMVVGFCLLALEMYKSRIKFHVRKASIANGIGSEETPLRDPKRGVLKCTEKTGQLLCCD